MLAARRAALRASSSALSGVVVVCKARGLLETVRRGLVSGLPSYKDGPHRSSAEKLVSKIPVIVVDDTVAVCDGGSGALGHPVEYIQLDTVSNKPQVCKYCGLQFKLGERHFH